MSSSNKEPPVTPRRSTAGRLSTTHLRSGPRTPNLAPSSSRRQSGRSSPTRRGSPSRNSSRLPVQFEGLSLASADTTIKLDNAVIIEVQDRYVKAGLSGSSKPLVCLDVNDRRVDGMSPDLYPYFLFGNLDSREIQLEKLLRYIFNNQLLTDAKQQRVMIIPPANCPIYYKQLISRVLFNRFQVNSIIFQPAPPLALLAAGTRNGLVIDFGWDELSVIPVYDLREMIPQTKSTTRGSRKIHEKLTELISATSELTPSFSHIDQMLCKTSNTDYRDDENILSVINDVLFHKSEDTHDDDSELNIVDLVFKVVSQLDMTTRGEVLSNIVFTGIYTNVKGLKTEIVKRIRQVDSISRGVNTLGYWQGASIYLSSIEWSLVHDDRLKFPGEYSKDRFDERYLMEELIA